MTHVVSYFDNFSVDSRPDLGVRPTNTPLGNATQLDFVRNDEKLMILASYRYFADLRHHGRTRDGNGSFCKRSDQNGVSFTRGGRHRPGCATGRSPLS